MRPLSLHHLNALDATPVELVRIAGQLEVELVCLFTHVPDAAAAFYPRVGPADVAGVAGALDASGVRVCNLEVFPLDRDGLDHLGEGLETGARLGPRATARRPGRTSRSPSSARTALGRTARWAGPASP